MLLLGLSAQSYAQNSDEGWVKRSWNNMIARYNIYFNAQQKLQASVKNLSEKQKDYFEDYLSVYPYGTEKDAKGMRSSMEEVMKKASKVIQHKPRSKWVDDAYFVIGQTHFFAGDYYAAIEAFQFVNSNFTDPEIKEMSQLWLMKSYIRQGKYDDAEAIFGLLKDNKSGSKKYTTHLNLSGGDLLVKQGKHNEAIEYLKKGVSKVKDKTIKYRTHFLLGQLYLNGEKYELANKHFVKVLKLNAPYEYVFQANIGMARASAETGGNGAKNTKKYLKRMLKDDKNIDYFDQIYFEIAKLEFASGNEEAGLQNMINSSKSAKNNNTQRTKTYLFLADYYFGKRIYDKAQAYYDSTISFIPDNFEDVDKIRAQHSVLSKLIENIETIRIQDSLLALSDLERDVLDKQITKIIEDEKERKRKLEEEELVRRERDRIAGAPPALPGAQVGSTWYFYNPSAISRGTNEFTRIWGNRKNGDFWRFVNKSVVTTAVPSSKRGSKPDDTDADPDTYSSSLDEEQKEALEGLDAERLKYYKDIPFSAVAKQVAEQKIQDAYLGIGKIYFDELKEYLKSQENFISLIGKYPKTDHKPEAIFYLAKIATNLDNESDYNKYAKQIADEFPETPYNQVLNAKEIVEDSKDKEVILLYEKMYDFYNAGDYKNTLAVKKEIDTDYPGSSIQAKVDYLFALTVGNTEGKEAYIKELKNLEEIYAGTEIGEMATFTLKLLKADEEPVADIYPEDSVSLKPKVKEIPSAFNKNINAIHYYVLTGHTTQEKNVQLTLDDYNKSFFGRQTLQISTLMLGDRQVFYVKQFPKKSIAMLYHEEMISNLALLENAGLSDVKAYAISEENFKTLFQKKNENEYIGFFKANYKR
jgi:TolA-binding protein